MLLNIIEYRGLSWIIVDYRGIAWISTTLVTHIGLQMLLKPLKTQPGRSALRNPCEGCHNLHRREGAVGPYGQARQDVTFVLRSKLWGLLLAHHITASGTVLKCY